MKGRVIFILLLFIFVGCNKQASNDVSLIDQEVLKDNVATAGIAYNSYTQESYEQALSEGKFVFLNFYANWCPICKREKPDVVNALKEISREDIAAFEVNYNDDETDENEKALAKKFGITYQHTKVIVDKNEKEFFRTLESLEKEELKTKIISSLS